MAWTMAVHASARTPKLYDCHDKAISLDEFERIML